MIKKKISIIIKQKVKRFNTTITCEGDKSLSHRGFLLASQTRGVSRLKGVLESEDVLSTINCLKKLGVKIIKKKNQYFIYGNGLNSFKISKKILLDTGNSGTLTRLIFGLLATNTSTNKIIVSGDQSLNKRDMMRIINPLLKIGCNISPKNRKTLPLMIEGTSMPLAQHHTEHLGSAQVKSCILMAALDTPGITTIKEKKPSRDHTENLLRYIGADIKVKKFKNSNLLELRGQRDIDCFNLEIPGDPSSSAFFIALTLLTKKSSLKINNINLNPFRTGFIRVLKKMNANIKILNVKKKFGEYVGDILVKSSNLKPIKFPNKEISSTIDEFPILFIIASQIKGCSTFLNIEELRKKESDRIKNIEIGLKKIGIKIISTKKSLKIFGDPMKTIKKTLKIDPKSDHRIAMSFFCLGLLIKGKIKILNFNTVNTSFPKFLVLMKNKIGAKFEVKKK
jgi:3-phosphoshikimate 1-carboxyvinyltransferase